MSELTESINKVKPVEQSGYWFFFEDNGKQVAAFGSFWSGREQVYYDGELVSDQRNITMSSHHEFEIENDKFEVTYNVTNLFRGTVECTLAKNGEVNGVETLAQISGTAKPSAKDMFMIFVIGFGFGVFGFGGGLLLAKLVF